MDEVKKPVISSVCDSVQGKSIIGDSGRLEVRVKEVIDTSGISAR
jgi:hypothetical protein